MADTVIGVIGGSGVYDIDGLEDASPAVGVVYDSDRANQDIVDWVQTNRPDWTLLAGWDFRGHLAGLAEKGVTRVLAEAGGGVAQAGELILGPCRDTAPALVLAKEARNIDIAPAELGPLDEGNGLTRVGEDG